MTDRELMQDALDALNNFDKGNHGMRWQVPIIKALRARLAQPEPAECDGGQCGIGGHCKECPKTKPEPEPEKSQDKPCVEDDGCPTEKAVLQRFWREHQAQPEREWVGLTDGERKQIEIKANDNSEMTAWEYAHRVGNFTEAKLKEKNT